MVVREQKTKTKALQSWLPAALHIALTGLFIWALFFPVEVDHINKQASTLRMVQIYGGGLVWVYYVLWRPWRRQRKTSTPKT